MYKTGIFFFVVLRIILIQKIGEIGLRSDLRLIIIVVLIIPHTSQPKLRSSITK